MQDPYICKDSDMKKTILFSVAVAALLASCKERAPMIIFGAPRATDTTYVLAAVPAPDARMVLVEEFTGAKCSNCPAAHKVFEGYQHLYPGRINIIELHRQDNPLTHPMEGAKYDLRHDEASIIADQVYKGAGNLPVAGISRFAGSKGRELSRTDWPDVIENQLKIADSINLAIESKYDASSGQATIKVTMIYVKPVAYPHNLSMAIVEDSLIDIQKYPSTDTVYPEKDDNYVFMNVFRGMVTAVPLGDPVLEKLPLKEPGRVVVRNYSYKPKVVDPAHCRVVAFVNAFVPASGDHHILQSASAPMK